MRIRIRQGSLPGYALGDYIDEAIDFLRAHEPPEGYFLGFSGGKDSIVCLCLCKMACVRFTAVYSCTRIDPPEMYRFIRTHYPRVQWEYPRESVYALIQRKAPPLRTSRWCCDELKKIPTQHIPLRHRIMGIRAEESARRASRPRVDTFKGQVLYKPLFAWPEWAVWECIEAYRLPYPRLYDKGWHRIGCVVCPFLLGRSAGKRLQRKRSMARWPGIWRAYEHAVKRWWCHQSAAQPDRPRDHNNPHDYWQDYLLGFE